MTYCIHASMNNLDNENIHCSLTVKNHMPTILKTTVPTLISSQERPKQAVSKRHERKRDEEKQASRSLAETSTQGRATLVAYKNRSLQSVNEESWPHERRECFGSFEPVFNDISLSVIVLTQPVNPGYPQSVSTYFPSHRYTYRLGIHPILLLYPNKSALLAGQLVSRV